MDRPISFTIIDYTIKLIILTKDTPIFELAELLTVWPPTRPETNQAAGRGVFPFRLATDQQIDRLVYQLYNLTEAEMKIVEGRAG